MKLPLRWGALLVLPGCFFALAPPASMSGDPPEVRRPDPRALAVPEGYRATVVASGLDFPVGVTVDEAGTVWVVEAGYSYGEVFLDPRLLKLVGDGTWEVAATGEDAPWTGVDAANGALFVVEGGQVDGGSVLRVGPDGVTALVTGLPGMGDHHTNGPVVHDGHVYFSQGTATNSGVVGLDNAEYGWLTRRPSHHDVPCAAVRVTDATWTTPNPLTEDESDEATTGPFAPFGQVRGPDIPGEIPCTGAVMRVPVDGGPVELVAWGFRNPFGLAFSGDRLYVTDNGYDVRGSRPVQGAGDWLWAVEPGAWYGWPDHAGGEPVDSRRFARVFRKPPKRVLAEDPGEPPRPVATFGVHASANGIAFAPDAFGFSGEAFVAELGDLAPAVGKVLAPVGRRVVRVDPSTGVIRPFLENAPGAQPGSGLERPVDVAFSPDGQMLYVVDFGSLTMDRDRVVPQADTGVVWRIERVGAPTEDAPLNDVETRGQQVFMRACHSCHPDAGAGFGPSALLPPRFVVPIQVRLGLGAMPAFSRHELPPDDLRALVAWLSRVDESNNQP